MKAILLVDDEPLVRETFRTILPWENHGFSIIATASQGEEALAILQQQQVDILVTDIRMPGMDGLVLIEKALIIDPTLAVVVLSSYDDYLLVRKAFNLGAHDYFLKAMSEPEELLDVLKKVSDTQDKYIDEAKYKNLFGRIGRNEAMLAYLLAKEASDDVLRNGLTLVREILDLRPFCVALISLEEMTENIPQFDTIIRKGCGASHVGDVFEISVDEFLVIHVLTSQELIEQDQKRIFLKFLSSVRRFYFDLLSMQRRTTELVFSVGISNVYALDSDLQHAVNEAKQLLGYRFASGKGSILSSSLFEQNKTIREHDSDDGEGEETISEIINAFTIGKVQDMHNLLNSYVSKAKKKRYDKNRVLHTFYFPLYMQIYLSLRTKGYDIRSISGSHGYLLETLSDALTLDDMNTLVKDWLQKLIGTLRSANNMFAGDIVLRARMFIDQHYKEPLRLEQIAQEVAVHPNYLSRLFTERVGKPLFSYINEVRIEKSKTALCSTDMRIYEIAYEHGFESAEYFCRIFKRVTGVSPNTFRSSCVKKRRPHA